MVDRKQKGEGDYESARRFNKTSTEFVQNNKAKISSAAQTAKRALDSPERVDLKRAEQEGKSHSKGEDSSGSKLKLRHK